MTDQIKSKKGIGSEVQFDLILDQKNDRRRKAKDWKIYGSY
jgi:hypothetical protein